MTPESERRRAVTLTRSLAVDHLADLVAIDHAAGTQLGRAYSDEAWGAEEFLKELPGKWAFSVAVLEQRKVRGFWIASQRAPQVIYTHRIAVDPASRQQGTGRTMFEAVRQRARSARLSRMALSVSMSNSTARKFFERLGFRRVEGDRIPEVLGGDHPHATFEVDHYRLPSGQRNLVYELVLEEVRLENSRDRRSS